MRLLHALAVLVTFGYLTVSVAAFANQWDVRADGSGDAPTIQGAIDLAAEGDSVVLAPGTYRGTGNRDISYRGKGLVVMSSSGRDVTIIDCEGAARGFVFNSHEPYSALLQGLTIVNGSGANGGGVYVSNLAHPLVRGCAVKQCSAVRGGAIYCGDMSAATFRNNLITGNSASYGGGISDDQFCFTHFESNTIQDNTASISGGGIYSENDTGESVFQGNVIARNTAPQAAGVTALGNSYELTGNRIVDNNGAGLFATWVGFDVKNNLIAHNRGVGMFLDTAAGRIENCTIVANASHGVQTRNTHVRLTRCIIAFNDRDAVSCSNASLKPVLECCDVFGNAGPLCAGATDNVITLNPLFCTDSGDSAYCLATNSPCAPAQSPCAQLIGALPVLCDAIPVVTLLECPPDTTVGQGPVYTLMTVGTFVIANPTLNPMELNYQVTSSGPATLLDGGNPGSLAGTTPLLMPGESYALPHAMLIAPNMANFEQEVVCHTVGDPGVESYCSTFVSFVQPVPVAFASARAKLDGRVVRLSWVAQPVGGVAEIAVRRRTLSPSSGAQEIIARLPVSATDYADATALPGETIEYDLAMIREGEIVSVSDALRVHVPALALAVRSIQPNPFRTAARVVFDVPQDGPVTLEVFDVAGRHVRTLVNRSLTAGTQDVLWEAGGEVSLRSGVYFMRLSQGKTLATAKVTLLK